MKIKFTHILITLTFLLFNLHISCDAPRNNPLDPKNPNSAFSSISGHVHTITDSRKPISNVAVYWRNADRLVFTNQNGSFSIQDVIPENGWLTFSREGYLPDSTEVIWSEGRNVNLQVSLNAKPHLDSLAIYSDIRNKHPNLKTARVIIKAKVTDADSDYDIDSVYVENSKLNIKSDLQYNVNDRLYEKTFSTFSLSIKSIQQVIGCDFEIKVVDGQSHTITVGKDQVRRVILDDVKYDSPSSYDVVPTTPQLQWHLFNPGFDFTFMIEIFTDEIIPQKVWEKSGIPADSTNITVDRTLPQGDYFWVIWCVDEFQNRSRSKPASFTVQ